MKVFIEDHVGTSIDTTNAQVKEVPPQLPSETQALGGCFVAFIVLVVIALCVWAVWKGG